MGAVLCVSDGVTVMLYKVMLTFITVEDITADQIILGIVKFFVMCLGGLLIGVIAGVVTALLTRLTVNVGGNSSLSGRPTDCGCLFGCVSLSFTSICLPVFVSVCLVVFVSACLIFSVFALLHVCPPACLCLPLCLSLCLSVCLYG